MNIYHKIYLMLCCLLFPQFTFASCANNPLECKKSAIKEFSEFNLDQYSKWSWLSGYEYSGLHWNQFISVYTNIATREYKNNYAMYIKEFLDDDDEDEEEEPALTPQQKGYMLYPTGTVFVKENYLADAGKPGQLVSVTVMVKHESGFDEEGGNWEYLQFSATGQLVFRGDSKNPAARTVCAGCHINVKERDNVFSTILSSSLQ